MSGRKATGTQRRIRMGGIGFIAVTGALVLLGMSTPPAIVLGIVAGFAGYLATKG